MIFRNSINQTYNNQFQIGTENWNWDFRGSTTDALLNRTFEMFLCESINIVCFMSFQISKMK